MELRELTKKEFDEFAINHPLGSFQQTSFWGRFMEGDKFHAYYVGGFIKEQLVGASLLLSCEEKKVKGRIFYAPRGFLIDYKNEGLLKKFTQEVKEFIKKKHGIFLRIDPYILVHDRDSDGNIIKGGVSNEFVEVNLLNSSFIKNDINIQPKWISRINLKEKDITDVFNGFSSKARQIIRKNERLGFKVRDLDSEKLDQFLKIMDDRESKYKIVTPTRTFYEELMTIFTKEYLQFKEIYLKKDDVIRNIDKEIDKILKEKEDRITNYHNSKMTEDYFIDKEFSDRKEIIRLNELKNYYSNFDDEVSLGIYLYITIGNEVLAFQGGIFNEYAKLDASYTMHYEMIKYAINNGYKYYNLYEIGDITDKNNKLMNSFNYKKNFGGEVVELIGTYDLIIDDKMSIKASKYFPEYMGVKTIFK